MSNENKEAMARWLPLVVSIISYVVIIGMAYGRLDQRLVPLETHIATNTTENQIKIFVTRAEWMQRNDSRDKELAELKTALRDINSKLDRLIEHEMSVKK